MLNITLISVGSLKESYWKEACAEYIKRLSRFAKVNEVEIEETRLQDNPNTNMTEPALEGEADRIIKKLPLSSFTVALCVEGEKLGSEEFANLLIRRMQTSSSFTFIIGGSYGLAQRIKDNASYKLSLSAMTFPHMAARVMLVEQLYRAFNMSNGGKYHK